MFYFTEESVFFLNSIVHATLYYFNLGGGITNGKTVITASSETNPKISDSITINVKETYNGFVDVTNPSAYYFDPVYWTKDSKITAGTTDTTFSPNKLVTRAEMISYLYRYSQAVGKTDKETGKSDFTDVLSSKY